MVLFPSNDTFICSGLLDMSDALSMIGLLFLYDTLGYYGLLQLHDTFDNYGLLNTRDMYIAQRERLNRPLSLSLFCNSLMVFIVLMRLVTKLCYLIRL